MSEWREVLLGSVADLINGDRGKNYPSAELRTESGIPFVNAGHLVDGRVRPGGDGFISHERYALLRSGLVEVGDILLCIRGSLGRVAIATPDVVPSAIASSLVIVRPREDVVPRFLLAVLQGPKAAAQIAASDNGVAQPNIGAAEVGRFRITLPPIATQHRVAGLLDALDDLIENNRRRIELLEQMAQAIYREWFVHFRYPGHEDAAFVDSALGPIPEGWEVTTVAGCAKALTRGISPKYTADGAWTVLNQKCIRDQRVSLERARRQERVVPPAKQVQFGDVLINSTGVGTLGRIAIFLGDHPALTVDSHVTLVRPSDPLANPWFGMNLLGLQAHFEALGTGSTGQTELSRKDIGATALVRPPSGLRRCFAESAWPLLTGTTQLLEQNRRLAGIRDLLLPKLVTGQIDVSELDLDALTESLV